MSTLNRPDGDLADHRSQLGLSNRTLALADDQNLFKNDPRLKYVSPSVREQWFPASTGTNLQYELMKGRYQKLLDVVRDMHRAEVRFLAGTDLGVPKIYSGFSLHDELALFVQAGFTPAEALLTATRNPAEFLGLKESLGTVEKEKIADLLLLDANPLLDINNTTRIAAVIVNGRYLSRQDLQRLLASVEAAVNKK